MPKPRKESPAQEQLIRGKRKKREKFILKTLLDGLLAGLIAIGVFLGRPPNEKPWESYVFVGFLIGFIFLAMVIFSLKFGRKQNVLGLLIVLGVSIGEVFLIGFAFQETIEMIIITIIIVSPSVIIFDKLLG